MTSTDMVENVTFVKGHLGWNLDYSLRFKPFADFDFK